VDENRAIYAESPDLQKVVYEAISLVNRSSRGGTQDKILDYKVPTRHFILLLWVDGRRIIHVIV
jgi:hypothetical protein